MHTPHNLRILLARRPQICAKIHDRHASGEKCQQTSNKNMTEPARTQQAETLTSFFLLQTLRKDTSS